MSIRDVQSMQLLADTGHNHVNLIVEEYGDVSVWLDTEVAECDGICIGVSKDGDKKAAVADAIQALEAAANALRLLS